MQYLIGYDISQPKRLQKLYKRIINYATPVQYSIFLFEGTNADLQICINEILSIIDKKEDDVRIYPLAKGGKQWSLGKKILPEGILWSALPQSFIK